MIEINGVINFDLYNCDLTPRQAARIIKNHLIKAREELKKHCTGLVDGTDVDADTAPPRRKDGQYAENKLTYRDQRLSRN